jgi:hypothetical protein
MTAPAPETLEREKLYVTDAELIRRMGVPKKIAREAINGQPLKLLAEVSYFLAPQNRLAVHR